LENFHKHFQYNSKKTYNFQYGAAERASAEEGKGSVPPPPPWIFIHDCEAAKFILVVPLKYIYVTKPIVSPTICLF